MKSIKKKNVESVVTWEKVAGTHGRNYLPGLLYYSRKWYSREELVKGISDAWTACEFPIVQLSMKKWMGLFGLVLVPGEFIYEEKVESAAAVLPETLVLYRGTQEKFGAGMSWTSRFDTALWFANRSKMFSQTPSHVYRVKVPRSSVLARFDIARKEAEYVVDVNQLTDVVIVDPPGYDPMVAEWDRKIS